MSRDKAPMTPAVRELKRTGVPFTEHPYTYMEYGGKRGFLVGLDPKELASVLKPTPVRVAVPKP